MFAGLAWFWLWSSSFGFRRLHCLILQTRHLFMDVACACLYAQKRALQLQDTSAKLTSVQDELAQCPT